MRFNQIAFAVATLFCCVPHLFAQTTIVNWGDPGGKQDIVSGSIPLNPFPTPTYAANSSNNPDVGFDYFPNSTEGYTPEFSAAGAFDDGTGQLNFLWARQIQENVNNGDRIRLENNLQNPNGGSTLTRAMVVWDDEDWLPSNEESLHSVTVEAFRSNPDPGLTEGFGRFLLENADGWYASEVVPLNPGFQTQGGEVDSFSWVDFTPMDAGVATFGAVSDPDFTGVTSVGYYFEVSNPTQKSLGAFIRHFAATTFTGSNGPACDFDGNETCDIADLNLMLAEGPIASGVAVTGANSQFDLDGNGSIDNADRDAWLSDAATENGLGSPYKVGDANLDGAVDVSDFNLWNSNKFTSGLQWDQGDFTGDGSIDVSDFNLWNGSKFTSSDSATVPEPNGIALAAMASLGLLLLRRKR